MRVIIRFSLDGDDGTLTSALNTVLTRNGLTQKTGTGTYEGSSRNVNTASLQSVLNDFWAGITNQNRAKLDHFWMNVDKGFSRTKKKATKKSSHRKDEATNKE
ncbi:MAG: hypothetical protein ABR912_11075 [Terracidiphilus sp.]|jgi:hypothetical protein